jgi:hypothetical protein
MVVGASGIPEGTLSKGRETGDIGLCRHILGGGEAADLLGHRAAAQRLEGQGAGLFETRVDRAPFALPAYLDSAACLGASWPWRLTHDVAARVPPATVPTDVSGSRIHRDN